MTSHRPSRSSLSLRVLIPSLALTLALTAGRAAAQTEGTTESNTVTVLNNLQVPVTIFLDYGDYDRRLGVIEPLSTGTLPLPAFALAELPTLQLYAKPEMSASLETHGFKVVPDMKVGWVVTKDIPSKAAGDTTKIAPAKPALAKTALVVENERDMMATVYAEENGAFAVKLGFVGPHGRATLNIPEALISSEHTIKVVVHNEGDGDMAPQVVDLGVTENAQLRIPARVE